ncbi:DUF167 domain-containing protein [Pararhodospirillum photometricum]|uniref:DUF167 domain-containing protein n=1 Tax=Pararhodospirillum photometricum TaxID=1084 RepID=UPI00059FEF92|nr:DUF167 domain-containing protein [Pararhodospirillum photometricum]
MHEDGVWIAVRVTPKARRVGVTGLAREADGTLVLKAGVSAPPEDGKANAALVELLAKSWGVPKRDVTVIQGLTDRRKVVRLAGAVPQVLERLGPWFEALPRL